MGVKVEEDGESEEDEEEVMSRERLSQQKCHSTGSGEGGGAAEVAELGTVSSWTMAQISETPWSQAKIW